MRAVGPGMHSRPVLCLGTNASSGTSRFDVKRGDTGLGFGCLSRRFLQISLELR